MRYLAILPIWTHIMHIWMRVVKKICGSEEYGSEGEEWEKVACEYASEREGGREGRGGGDG